MGISRYKYTPSVVNATPQYANILARRGKTLISHFSFDKFKQIKLKDVPGLQIDTHTWTTSDRFYKLAYQYYGDPTYWWIIAFWNHKPLESDVAIGQKIHVPMPVEKVLSALEMDI
tara:strand:- start:64 stop:411 length:348 start_codon:yes stop_codon:yes gene_type:complete